MTDSYYYNPVPPRAWSRVQNQCSTNPTRVSSGDIVYSPLTKQYSSPAVAAQNGQMLSKGNILQYKNNSGNLSKKQKYSKIAQGKWVGKKSYATQSETYTNPNTTGFQRVDYDVIPYPNYIIGSPNNPSGPFQINAPNPNDCSFNYIQDGGTLVCNTYVDPCTGEIIQRTKYQECFLTSCSDVPGPIQPLCWNDGIQTWYPRNRLTMSNSGNKWPEGYKGFVSAVTLPAPTLSATSYSDGSVVFEWVINSIKCIPITQWTLYKNGRYYNNIAYPLTSSTVYGLNKDKVYEFYIVGQNYSAKTYPSNKIYVTLTKPPTINVVQYTSPTESTIYWTPNDNILYIQSFTIYCNDVTNPGNEIVIDNISATETSYIIPNLTEGNVYDVYMTSTNDLNGESSNSNIYTFLQKLLTPPIVNDAILGYTVATVTWTPTCVINSSQYTYNIYYSTDSINYTKIENISYTVTSYLVTNLNNNNSYYFYMTLTAFGVESTNSNVIGPKRATYGATGTFTKTSNSGFNTILIFTDASAFTSYITQTIKYVIVAGGSAGGVSSGGSPSNNDSGGGGGAGGNVLNNSVTLTPNVVCNIVIGAHGSGGNGYSYNPSQGGSSSFGSISATPNAIGGAASGGTGGTGGAGPYGTGTTSAGGNGGSSGSSTQAISGYNGVFISDLSDLSPNYGYFAGGGGGGSYFHQLSSSVGGFYGGGGGGATGGDAKTNTGSGGGGQNGNKTWPPNNRSGNGGTGVVILYWND